MKHALFCLSIFAATPALAQQAITPPWPDTDHQLTWIIANLNVNPDDVVSWNENMIVEIDSSSIRRSGSLVTAWFERDMLNHSAADELGGRSMVILRQSDCDTLRSRALAITRYEGHDRTGRAISTDTASDWTYDRPGTVGADQTSAACNATRALDESTRSLWQLLAAQ